MGETAADLLERQLAIVKKQIDKVLQSFPQEHLDFKATEQAMSAREQLLHLGEVSLAVVEATKGAEHLWGTYEVQDTSFNTLMKSYEILRSEAVEASLSSGDETLLEKLMNFIVLHEAYHVGQLALTRLAVEPEWNAYTIYE